MSALVTCIACGCAESDDGQDCSCTCHCACAKPCTSLCWCDCHVAYDPQRVPLDDADVIRAGEGVL